MTNFLQHRNAESSVYFCVSTELSKPDPDVVTLSMALSSISYCSTVVNVKTMLESKVI